MIKIISALSGAALLAGLIVLVPGLSGDVAASTPQPLVKSDRLDLRASGAACSKRGWPHFETACLRDVSNPSREAKTVRIVSADRIR